MMSPEQLHCYTDEVYLHAKIAIDAFLRMSVLLENQETRQLRLVWVHLQTFLTHTGMVSKLLSPPTKDTVSKSRGEQLSKHLNLPTSSALFDRDARNAIEHLDERMDYWLKTNKSGFLECVFENRKRFEYLDQSNWAVRRVFLLEEFVFVTEGKAGREEMEILPLFLALNKLIQECETRFETSDPYHYAFPRTQNGFADSDETN